MKISKLKRNIILLCIGVLSVILAVWTVWGNTALMMSEISISSEHLPDFFQGFALPMYPICTTQSSVRAMQPYFKCCPSVSRILL